ncbi:MAG TPA: hypothetical protein VN039_05645 [Nitrospira sp.]|nr:hypothetical protein [Nitrospira sp.]
MASGVTQIADVVVPELFTPYVQQLTEQKSRLVQSGAITRDSVLDNDLMGGGLTFNEPSFKDLDNDADNIATDDPTAKSTPFKTGSATEIQVRLSRNGSWSSMDLAGDLAGADPMMSIANRVAYYWTRREQAAFVATINGIFANNATATDTHHTQNDMTHDISGASFADGVTNFSAEAFIDATLTMGDSMDRLSMVMVNSVVYGRMQKNNLIDFIPDSEGKINIPTFLGRIVIVDDGVPYTAGVFETWLFGAGAVRQGVGNPKTPTEVWRDPAAGNGSGQSFLYNRKELIFHPVGHAYVGTAPKGGPDNTNAANMLAAATSWQRVFPERKQIRIARLKTREF